MIPVGVRYGIIVVIQKSFWANVVSIDGDPYKEKIYEKKLKVCVHRDLIACAGFEMQNIA